MKKMIFIALFGIATLANALVVGTGSKIGSETVLAYDNDSYQFDFVGGYQAGAYLSGDGDTDLDLYVYDENGNLVCKSISNSDNEYCTWNPRWTGPFKVTIKNRGTIANRYILNVR